MGKLNYTEVSRSEYNRPSPYHYGAPAGTDYYTVIVYRAVWPEDGSTYAGKSYDRRETWIGPEQGMRHVLVNSESYPTGYFDKKEETVENTDALAAEATEAGKSAGWDHANYVDAYGTSSVLEPEGVALVELPDRYKAVETYWVAAFLEGMENFENERLEEAFA